jgi:acyl-CoA-binding protein
MSELDVLFQAAVTQAKSLPTRPGNDDLLALYAHYKQATLGDAGDKRPGLTDPVGRAKYNAWAKLQGLSQPAARQAYVDLVERLKNA